MKVVVNRQLTPTAKEQWKPPLDRLERGNDASNVQRGDEAGATRKYRKTQATLRNIRPSWAAVVTLAPQAPRLV